MKTWVWEKEASHRLFNFSEGYVELPDKIKMIGSCKCLKQVNVLTARHREKVGIDRSSFSTAELARTKLKLPIELSTTNERNLP